MDKARFALNTTSNLLSKSFSPKSARLYDKIPYVSIILLIVAIVCKTIQKVKNNQNYLQNNQSESSKSSLDNFYFKHLFF